MLKRLKMLLDFSPLFLNQNSIILPRKIIEDCLPSHGQVPQQPEGRLGMPMMPRPLTGVGRLTDGLKKLAELHQQVVPVLGQGRRRGRSGQHRIYFLS